MRVDVAALFYFFIRAGNGVAVFYNKLALVYIFKGKLMPLGYIFRKLNALVRFACVQIFKRNGDVVEFVYYYRLFSHLQIPLLPFSSPWSEYL